MKFADKYPNTQYLEQVGGPGDPFIIKGNEMRPCFVCEQLTDFIDGDFETEVCSEECDEKLWQEYEAACCAAEIREAMGRITKDWIC